MQIPADTNSELAHFFGGQVSIRMVAEQAQAETVLVIYLFQPLCGYGSNAKTRFQSFFMLMTIQPCFCASSYSGWVKAPTLVLGRPWAGP
jgi:hypothetical protein